MSPSPQKSAALYIRVSTHEQEELSPDSQRRLLLEYAASHGLAVSDRWIYQENGVSGRKALKRPQFQRMIADAKSASHPFDVILVWKFSRFARNQEESIVYKSMLRNKCRVEVVSISEPVMDGPFGSLIERIIEWMDEFYSIRLSGDVTRGMTEKAIRGGCQCRPPLGYRAASPGSPLVPVPEEVPIVRQIFQWAALDRESPASIAKRLNFLGIRTRNGGPFEARAVDYILNNPIYMGKVRWNRTDSRTGAVRDPSQWIITEGSHPPIVSPELFARAASRSVSERPPRQSRPAGPKRHWLCGLLSCPGCGRRLSSCIRRRKSLPDTVYFQCGGYRKGSCVRSCYITEEAVVPAVLHALEAVQSCPIPPAAVSPPAAEGRGGPDFLSACLSRLHLREQRARDAYLNGLDSREEYGELRRQIQQERERLLSLSGPEAPPSSPVPIPASLTALLASDAFTVSQKHSALKSVVHSISFDKQANRITVRYRAVRERPASSPPDSAAAPDPFSPLG